MRHLLGVSFACVLLTTALPFAAGCGGSGSGDPDAGEDAERLDGAADAGSDGTTLTDRGNVGEYCPVVGYSPCGGDLVATWAFRSLCPDDPEAAAALCEHPYDDRPICTGDGNEAICDGTTTGTLTFHADMTIEWDTQISLVTTWHLTDECLEAVVSGTTAEERCLGMTKAHLTCTYQELCTCVSDPMVEGDAGSGTYQVTGNEVIIGEDPPSTYCVDGDRLTMDYYVYHPVSWRYWVLERE